MGNQQILAKSLRDIIELTDKNLREESKKRTVNVLTKEGVYCFIRSYISKYKIFQSSLLEDIFTNENLEILDMAECCSFHIPWKEIGISEEEFSKFMIKKVDFITIYGIGMLLENHGKIINNDLFLKFYHKVDRIYSRGQRGSQRRSRAKEVKNKMIDELKFRSNKNITEKIKEIVRTEIDREKEEERINRLFSKENNLSIEELSDMASGNKLRKHKISLLSAMSFSAAVGYFREIKKNKTKESFKNLLIELFTEISYRKLNRKKWEGGFLPAYKYLPVHLPDYITYSGNSYVQVFNPNGIIIKHSKSKKYYKLMFQDRKKVMTIYQYSYNHIMLEEIKNKNYEEIKDTDKIYYRGLVRDLVELVLEDVDEAIRIVEYPKGKYGLSLDIR